MKKATYLYKNGVWNKQIDASLDSEQTLVLCFGTSDYPIIKDAFEYLETNFKNSTIIGCSTSGEIYQDELFENSLSVAVIKFEKTKLRFIKEKFDDISQSYEVGIDIATKLQDEEDLKSIFILSDGLFINGSKLTKGINSCLNKDVIVSGGLAGDDDRFAKTWIYANKDFISHSVIAIGFYGKDINVLSSSYGGWQQFGINRKVTKAVDNTLFEIDNKPALKIYKDYLGENSKNLPASGLFFPLMIKEKGYEKTKVRTILSIDEVEQSITFAGDIPVDSEVMLMKASFSDLINGASKSCEELLCGQDIENAINIAISCVGRKLVLGQKTEDEIDAVFCQLGKNVEQVGFYSYGEIAPFVGNECDLYNQTMTLTLIWETV